MLEVGDRAADFTLESVDAGPVALSTALPGARATLLVFLRHLG